MIPHIIKAPKFIKQHKENCHPKQENLPFLFSIGSTDESASTQNTSNSIIKTEDSFQGKRDQRIRRKFRQELMRIGINEKSLMDRNPVKKIEPEQKDHNQDTVSYAGLPFQRRARSLSPPRESLKVYERKNYIEIPSNSPVVPSHKQKFSDFEESYQLLCKDTIENVDEDEDLKAIKAEYCKMLEQAPRPIGDCGSDIDDDDWEELMGCNDISQFLSSGRLGF